MRTTRFAWMALLAVVATLAGCGRAERREEAQASQSVPPVAIAARPGASNEKPAAAPTAPTRNLSVDESMGGHTLSRHVGRTDAQLRERLRLEPDISAASTYTDRAAAERTVGAALASGGRKLESWEARKGRRPNLVLNYTDRSAEPVGRSIGRGDRAAVPCSRALIVLRWDERRDRYYVLTSYPEAG